MAVIKNKPGHGKHRKTLVNALAKELDADSEAKSEKTPNIYENYSGFSGKFSVRVVWDDWEGVAPRDRVEIILDGYRQSKRQGDVQNITAAVGVTPTENWLDDAKFRAFGVDPDQVKRMTSFFPKKY